MSAPPDGFSAEALLQNVAAFVKAQPQRAGSIYRSAAATLRQESQRRPQDHAQLFTLALKLERMAREAEPLPVPRYGDRGGPLGLPDDVSESEVYFPDGNPGSFEFAARGDPVAEALHRGPEPAGSSMTPAQAKGATHGSQVIVQFGGSSNQLQGTPGAAGGLNIQQEAQIVNWEGQETRACTVSVRPVSGASGATWPQLIAPQTQYKAPGFYTYRPYVHAFWGNSLGAPCELYADVGRGVNFTVAAAFIYVNVGMESSRFTPGSMAISGSVSFFNAARQAKVYRTAYVDLLDSMASATIQIPLFATTLEYFATQTLANWSVSILTGSGIITTLNPPTNAGLIPLPGDALFLGITNNGMTADSADVVFGLSL